MPSADSCYTFKKNRFLSSREIHDMQQISRGKFDRLQRTTARFTCTRLDGYGLRCSLPTRPRVQASYLVFVHRRTLLLHASFRPHLAMTPLRFANPSPPSGWIRDSHPQTVEHARHTMTEYGKHGKPRSRLSTLPTLLGNPFGITTFPRPRLLAYSKVRKHERPNPRQLDLKGVVTEVLGPKCNERSSTLTPLRSLPL